MSLRPGRSRSQITWKQFLKKEDGSWFLNLQPYYADLFAVYFPHIMRRSRTGFKPSKSGKTKFAFFRGLVERDLQRIESFIKFFGQAVCLDLNRHLGNNFSNELDFCLALDFTKPSPDKERTVVGELEYQAKYHHNSEAITELAKELAFAIQALPPSAIPRPRL